MKKILATLSLLSALFAVSAAHANVMMHGQRADILTMNVDPEYANRAFNRGRVEINDTLNNVSVTLYRATPPCPPNRACPMYMPAPTWFTAAIVSKTTDSCGVVTTVARTDGRISDANLTEIIVKDHAQDRCEGVFNAWTEIEVNTASSGFNPTGTIIETHSTFTAERLVKFREATQFEY